MRISDWSSDVCSSDLRKWKMVPGRFKDYISTSKRNGYKSLHTTIMHDQNMRVEIQIRSRTMHEQSEYGLAAHWAYKQGGRGPDGQAGWIRDLIEILEQTHRPEEHTSELQSLMRIAQALCCFTKTKNK